MDSVATIVIYAGAGYAASVFAPSFDFDDRLYLGTAIAGLIAFRIVTPVLVAGPVFDASDLNYPDLEVRAASRRKFASHLNKFCIHLLFQMWGLRVLLAEEWFSDWLAIDSMWEGWSPTVRNMSDDFRAFYLTQMAFFMGSLVMQPFEPRSHDHIAMMAHHAGASTLVACSYIFCCHRIGLLILVVRELTDVMIHMARTLSFLQYKTPSEIILVLLTFAWAVTRNWYYGCIICASVWSAPLAQYSETMWQVCFVLCGLLVPLDVYYLQLALSAIVKRITNPKAANIDPDAPKGKNDTRPA